MGAKTNLLPLTYLNRLSHLGHAESWAVIMPPLLFPRLSEGPIIQMLTYHKQGEGRWSVWAIELDLRDNNNQIIKK